MALPGLSDDQRLYLQTIFDYFHEHGKWPTYKYIDRKLIQIRRDLDIEEISKGLPTGFATAFAFNHNLNANAVLNTSAMSACNGSKEDLADFIRAIAFCVEKYFTSEEDSIEICSDDFIYNLSMSDLSVRKVGLLIRDASEYPIYQSFGCKDTECNGWTCTLSRNIRYINGVTSIEEYLARIDQLRKPPLSTSRSQAQTSEVSNLPKDRSNSKPSSASSAKEGYLFQEFTRELLQALGFTEVIEPKEQDASYDFQAIYPINSPSGLTTQQLWIIEAKFRNPGRKTTLDALHQLVAYTQLMKPDKALLVTNTSLTSFAKEFIMQLDTEVKSKLEVWDGDKLLSLQAQFPNLERRYANVVAKISPSSSKPFTTRQQRLIEQLARCQPGQQDAHKYEDVCTDILTEVFVPPLKPPKIQARTLNGLERRDALFSLRGVKHGWEEIHYEFAANFLLCEFKNYTDLFDKDEVNQTRNYLKHTIGRLGIIFSRNGASPSAMRMRNSIYAEDHGKVILFFEDKHLIELLKMKEAGQTPLELIQEAIDEFYISYE